MHERDSSGGQPPVPDLAVLDGDRDGNVRSRAELTIRYT
jgi:hypothetical protein